MSKITEQIGPLVIDQVKLEEEITILKARLIGARQPSNEREYANALGEKIRQLQDVKEHLRALRFCLIEEMGRRAAIIEMEIQNSFDAFDIEEMKGMKSDLENKIQQLKNICEQ